MIVDIYSRYLTALYGMEPYPLINIITGTLAFFPNNDNALLTSATLASPLLLALS
jgi:hypothetical protein